MGGERQRWRIKRITARRGHGEAGHRFLCRKTAADSLQRPNTPHPPLSLSRIDLGSSFRCVTIFLSLARKNTQQQHHVYLLSLILFYFALFLYPLLLFPTSGPLPLFGDLFLRCYINSNRKTFKEKVVGL